MARIDTGSVPDMRILNPSKLESASVNPPVLMSVFTASQPATVISGMGLVTGLIAPFLGPASGVALFPGAAGLDTLVFATVSAEAAVAAVVPIDAFAARAAPAAAFAARAAPAAAFDPLAPFAPAAALDPRDAPAAFDPLDATTAFAARAATLDLLATLDPLFDTFGLFDPEDISLPSYSDFQNRIG